MMPPQVTLSRICLQCRMHIFSNGFRLMSFPRHLRTSLPNSTSDLWGEKLMVGYRKFSTENATPENSTEDPLQEEAVPSESEPPTSESAALSGAVSTSEPTSSKTTSEQIASASETSPKGATSILGIVSTPETASLPEPASTECFSMWATAPTPGAAPPTESRPLNGTRLDKTSSSETQSTRIPSTISNASDFLASRRFLGEDTNKEAPPRPPVDIKAREKAVLKTYRVLLRDTKVEVDLDEVMKVATTEPSPLPPGGDENWGRIKPLRPSELVPPHLLDAGMKFKFPAATHRVADIDKELVGELVVLHGYFGAVRRAGKFHYFSSFHDYYSNLPRPLKVVSVIDSLSHQITKAAHQTLGSLHRFTPVALRATVYKCAPPKSPEKRKPDEEVELRVKEIIPLNSVSENLIYTAETIFPPEKRHLQLRTTTELYTALRLRSRTASECRKFLEENDFLEVETPLLFKSTPEGAREFLVPTRKGDGTCYALPQSPQQYKQILMASGVPRYYQLAKCFRDEDLRADRQPEFTQLDLEMSFATSNDVMDLVEKLIIRIWDNPLGVRVGPGFKRVPYWWAMKNYGTDKPDFRYPNLRIKSLQEALPHLAKADKFVEGFVFYGSTSNYNMDHAIEFLEQFKRENPSTKDDNYVAYVAGTGNETQAYIEGGMELWHKADLANIHEALWVSRPGTIVVIKERRGHYSGGNTKLGLLRSALLNKAIEQGLVRSRSDYAFVWVVDFPLFSPTSADDPSRPGEAPFSPTHHPFTAPIAEDIQLLRSSPHRVRAEHYDLIVNGTELGGGSRRIHEAALQKYILEGVFKMPRKKLQQFDHLLEVLDSGCPPHAGIALGFDRLIAVMMGRNSIRDVIAFPKNSKGADVMVGSPSAVPDKELRTYGLRRS
ncbi:tRNA synthetases class II-domain-containing protein [Tuber brumale]|nr:tRNA synthetases class II-domain-containing protein [Tuber brumale]